MSGELTILLQELRTGLGKLYGDRLRGVYVYGSYARGDDDAESDLDILIVLDDFSSYAAEVDRTSELGSTISLDYGVSISRVFLREPEWMTGGSTFLRNVRAEATPV